MNPRFLGVPGPIEEAVGGPPLAAFSFGAGQQTARRCAIALNDFFRFNRTPLGLDIVVGSSKLQIRDGYVIMPQQPTASEGGEETGSKWNNSDTGRNRQTDSLGTRDDA